LPFAKYAKLHIVPHSMDKKGLFIEERQSIYNSLVLSGGMKDRLKERLKFIKQRIDEFKPTMFVTEYFPFGRELWSFQLPYILGYIKTKFPCQVVCSSGYINYSQGLYENIEKYYDYLFIHSPREFARGYSDYLHKKAAEILDVVFKDFSSKIKFTGFVFEDQCRISAEAIRGRYLNNKFKKLILVSRGGGIVNKKIILSSLGAARKNKDSFFLISCGPSTPGKELNQYRKISKSIPNLKLLKAINPVEFDCCLKAADLSVSMAGYNTVARLLYYKKKAVIIPYYTSEQRWRAEIAARNIGAEIINEKKLSPGLLEEKISLALQCTEKKMKVESSWFEGVSSTLEGIKCLIQK